VKNRESRKERGREEGEGKVGERRGGKGWGLEEERAARRGEGEEEEKWRRERREDGRERRGGKGLKWGFLFIKANIFLLVCHCWEAGHKVNA